MLALMSSVSRTLGLRPNLSASFLRLNSSSGFSAPSSKLVEEHRTAPSAATACDPFQQGSRPLPADKVQQLLKNISGWSTTMSASDPCQPIMLKRQFNFNRDLNRLRAFVSSILSISQNDAHYPHSIDIRAETASVEVSLYTPRLGGLSYNDFQLGLKFDCVQVASASDAGECRTQSGQTS